MRTLLLLFSFSLGAFAFGQVPDSPEELGPQWYLSEGNKLIEKGRFDSAKTSYLLGAAFYQNQPVDSILAQLYNNLGVVAYYQSDLAESIEKYETAKEIYDGLGQIVPSARIKLNLGLTYKKKGMYQKAYTTLKEAVPVFEKENKFNELASTLNSLGNLRKETRNFDEALDYLNRALFFHKKNGYERGIAKTLNNIGQVFLLQNQLDSAEFFLNEALELKNELGLENRLGATLSLLAELKLKQGDLSQSENYAIRSLENRYEFGNDLGIATSLNRLSKIKLGQNKFKEVDSLLVLAWEYAVDKNRTLVEIARTRINWAKTTKNSEIIQWYDCYISLKDSIFKMEQQEVIERLEIEMGVKKNKEKLEKITEKNQNLTNKNTVLESSNLNLTFGLLILILLLSLLAILYSLNRRKGKLLETQKIEIEKQSDQIRHLHREHVHRTKNHFAIIIAMLDPSMSHQYEGADRLTEAFRMRVESISMIDRHLIEQVGAENKQVNLKTYLDELLANVHLSYGGDDHCLMHSNTSSLILTHQEALRIGVIINELVTNAFKYAQPDGEKLTIWVTCENKGDELYLSVADNGGGHESDKSTFTKGGLGTELVKTFVMELGGSLEVESQKGYVTTIRLPKKEIGLNT